MNSESQTLNPKPQTPTQAGGTDTGEMNVVPGDTLVVSYEEKARGKPMTPQLQILHPKPSTQSPMTNHREHKPMYPPSPQRYTINPQQKHPTPGTPKPKPKHQPQGAYSRMLPSSQPLRFTPATIRAAHAIIMVFRFFKLVSLTSGPNV